MERDRERTGSCFAEVPHPFSLNECENLPAPCPPHFWRQEAAGQQGLASYLILLQKEQELGSQACLRLLAALARGCYLFPGLSNMLCHVGLSASEQVIGGSKCKQILPEVSLHAQNRARYSAWHCQVSDFYHKPNV